MSNSQFYRAKQMLSVLNLRRVSNKSPAVESLKSSDQDENHDSTNTELETTRSPAVESLKSSDHDENHDSTNTNAVVEVKFIRGSRKLFFKVDFDEPYVELNFLMKKFNANVLPAVNNTPRGIKTSKKEGILSKLVPLMPVSRRQFWTSLPVCDAAEDLVSEGQMVTEE